MIYVNALDYTIQVITNEDGEIVVTTENNSTITAATQSEVNAGTGTGYVSPSTLQDRDDDVVALTDAATIDLTGPKHTLSTSTGRTFTISYPGDNGVIEITLNATSATFTFPAAWKGISESQSSGDNTVSLSGTSGDVYLLVWIKVGSNYTVASKNTTR